MRFWIVLYLCFASSLWAADLTQEEQAVQIGRDLVKTLNGLGELSSLPPAMNDQVRDIARKLAAEMPVSDEEFQQVFTEAEKEDQEQSRISSKILKNVAIGIIICLVLFIISIIGRKIKEGKEGEKDSLNLVVNPILRSAPFVLFIPMPSNDAGPVGRELVEKRLAARVDILNNQFLSDDASDDVVLMINTVKGRLKELNKLLKELSVSSAGLSFPVLSGHKEYLTWIADAADGRG